MSNDTTLAALIERQLGRALTAEEMRMATMVEQEYGYAPDDPLFHVIAFLGAHKVLMEDIPARLKAVADQSIALHKMTLEEQSTIVAKQLVVTIGQLLPRKSRREQVQEWLWTALIGAASASVVALVVVKGFRF